MTSKDSEIFYAQYADRGMRKGVLECEGKADPVFRNVQEPVSAAGRFINVVVRKDTPYLRQNAFADSIVSASVSG